MYGGSSYGFLVTFSSCLVCGARIMTDSDENHDSVRLPLPSTVFVSRCSTPHIPEPPASTDDQILHEMHDTLKKIDERLQALHGLEPLMTLTCGLQKCLPCIRRP